MSVKQNSGLANETWNEFTFKSSCYSLIQMYIKALIQQSI